MLHIRIQKMNLKSLILLLGFCFFNVHGLLGQPDNPTLTFASLHGTSGAIQTSDAKTIGKFRGNIGVFENFRSDSLDRITFCFGVHDHIEVGLQSEIPTKADPRMNFFFKVKGNDQGNYFGLKSKFIPATAFGIHRRGAFAVASYQIHKVLVSVGYNFSDDTNGAFANLSYYPVRFIAVQAECLSNVIGVGLRGNYKGIEMSLMYSHPLSTSQFISENRYLRIAYNFR